MPQDALGDHLGHGDTLGSCPGPCPCFSGAGITLATEQCDGATLLGCATSGETAFVIYGCPGPGTVPDTTLLYSSSASEGVCRREDFGPSVELSVDPKQHTECVAALGTCPS